MDFGGLTVDCMQLKQCSVKGQMLQALGHTYCMEGRGSLIRRGGNPSVPPFSYETSAG